MSESKTKARNHQVMVRDQMAQLAHMNGLKVTDSVKESLLPTPNTMDHLPARDESKIDRSKGGYANVRETVVREFVPDRSAVLPPPTVTDVYTANLKSSQMSEGSMHSVSLPRLVHKPDIDWGRFDEAIARWEKVIGRQAPDPTKPDGKDATHRLSSSFTEWMMGLPEGFITNADIDRKEELRACGNGVVPQQAELALKELLELE